jgi:putative lipase involved disintegration of autophagic bodies
VPIASDENALITGHSLGGGLAKILAMITEGRRNLPH